MSEQQDILQSWIKTLLNKNWNFLLKTTNYIQILSKIAVQIKKDIDLGKSILPEKKYTFRVFNDINPEDIKVVLIGMDPYPTKDVPDGLAFSCSNSLKPNASLKKMLDCIETIYKDDNSIGSLDKLDLSRWLKQGVFLCNTALTVEEKKPGTYISLWKPFTQLWIEELSKAYPDKIWILLGNNAQEFKPYIKQGYIFEEGHPSPLNTKKPFTGVCFLQANDKLKELNKKIIQWR